MANNPRRIAIIGGGLTGLTAAYNLSQTSLNLDITIYESSAKLGGLAAGFKGKPEWQWPLEHFYHHLFTNDDAIFSLTEQLRLSHLLEIHNPVTTMYFAGKNYPFDSPLRLLQFPHLSLLDKLRMGMVLAYLRFHPHPPWRRFDRILAHEWLRRWMGRRAYEMLWRPMLQGKFDVYYDKINLAWFWARIYKRTPQLGYYRGGFQAFVDGLVAQLNQNLVTIYTECPVDRIAVHSDNSFMVDSQGNAAGQHDFVLSTVSPGLMTRLIPELPADYLGQLSRLTSMGAVVLTVALDRKLMDGIYWVNVPKPAGIPFLALVEHTAMIDPVYYGGDHLLYLGNYLSADHPYFAMSSDELLAEFVPHLKAFNASFEPDWVTGAWVHKAAYAQPVPPVGYANMIPSIRTPIDGLYFASMSQVYPWDRGTNYAVEMGQNVSKMMEEDIRSLQQTGAKV